MPVSTDLRVYDERALFALGNKDLKDLCNHHGIWPATDDPCTGLGLRVCRAESLYETVS